MIRGYQDSDYEKLHVLYQHTEWYGGVFDEARDGRDRLARKIADDPEAILVYEQDGELIGTISLIDDGRVAWFYRFIARDNDPEIAKALHVRATEILKSRGHTQVLVYSSVDDQALDKRYKDLGMNRGDDYACYWQEL